MGITRVTRGWQITLPKDVRELLGFEEGERLLVKVEKDKAVIEKLRKDFLEGVLGAWGRGEPGAKTIRRIRRESEKRLEKLGL